MKTVPVTEAKGKLLELVSGVQERDETVMITKKGRPAAVLLSVEDYESLRETIRVLTDRELLSQLKAGETYFGKGGAGKKIEETFLGERP